MKGKNKRRSATCVEKDRISNLPAHVIESILERVPFEDVVRTSIISKNWRYRWTTMKKIDFGWEFAEKFAKNEAFGRNGFIRIINQVLILHKGHISEFKVVIPKMNLDSLQEVDQWMLLLSRTSVTDLKELNLVNYNRRYKLPSYVFSFLGLTKLYLENYFFKPPPEFEGFPNLEELSLSEIDFGDNLCGTQINLPQLKRLLLSTCTNVYNFNIKATKLETLIVITCPDAMLLQLLDNPCLNEVGLSLRTVEDFVGIERMNLVSMLNLLPRIEHFLIDGNFLKFMFPETVPHWNTLVVNSLKRLTIPDFDVGQADQLLLALCLLCNSPNLETLSIFYTQEARVDEGPALILLEAENCLTCTLNQLQTVEIKSLEGSRPELLFIKLLLAHSPSLEKLTITPSEDLGVQKMFEIAKNVMRFPRASTKAEMIYLNPEP